MSKRSGSHELRESTKDFIGGTGHVCPLGTMAERAGEVAYSRIDDARVEDSIRKALTALLADKKAAVLMFPNNSTNEEQCTTDAIRYMIAAGTILARTLYPDTPVEDIREALEVQIGDVLRDKNAEVTPHLVAKHPITGFPNNIFTIFMGPFYKKPHSRWAPYPMLVLTWAMDVQQANISHPELVESIHRKINAIFGGLYDADLLVLPQEPEIIRPRSIFKQK